MTFVLGSIYKSYLTYFLKRHVKHNTIYSVTKKKNNKVKGPINCLFRQLNTYSSICSSLVYFITLVCSTLFIYILRRERIEGIFILDKIII